MAVNAACFLHRPGCKRINLRDGTLDGHHDRWCNRHLMRSMCLHWPGSLSCHGTWLYCRTRLKSGCCTYQCPRIAVDGPCKSCMRAVQELLAYDVTSEIDHTSRKPDIDYGNIDRVRAAQVAFGTPCGRTSSPRYIDSVRSARRYTISIICLGRVEHSVNITVMAAVIICIVLMASFALDAIEPPISGYSTCDGRKTGGWFCRSV